MQEEIVDALGAVEGQKGTNVLEPPVLENARQHGVGLPFGVDGVEVDVPEEPAHALR